MYKYVLLQNQPGDFILFLRFYYVIALKILSLSFWREIKKFLCQLYFHTKVSFSLTPDL